MSVLGSWNAVTRDEYYEAKKEAGLIGHPKQYESYGYEGDDWTSWYVSTEEEEFLLAEAEANGWEVKRDDYTGELLDD